MFKECLKKRAFVSCMQTKTLLFKRVIIRCSRIHEQGIFLSEMYCSDSLEYGVRCVVVVVEYTSLDVTLRQ